MSRKKPDNPGEETMNRPSDDYYSDLDSRLRSLVTSLHSHLEQKSLELIEDCIAHAEYGVALMLTTGKLVEAGSPISAEAMLEITALANTMGIAGELDSSLWADPPASL